VELGRAGQDQFAGDLQFAAGVEACQSGPGIWGRTAGVVVVHDVVQTPLFSRFRAAACRRRPSRAVYSARAARTSLSRRTLGYVGQLPPAADHAMFTPSSQGSDGT